MKNIIKKIGYGLSAAAVMAFCAVGIIGSAPQTVNAASPQKPICDGIEIALGINNCGDSDTNIGSVWTIVGTAVNWILVAVGIVCVIFIIFGGIRYATSGGDAEKVKKAKNTLLYAIIGLAIALLAAVIVNLVINLTGNIQDNTL